MTLNGEPYVATQGVLHVNDEPGGGIHFHGTLAGLEPFATGGFHIHTGYTCADAAYAATSVGGHYWPNMVSDPWASNAVPPVTYTADAYGTASIHQTIVGDFSL